jgi:glycosyltransferase involved in cell wall biosynthesis
MMTQGTNHEGSKKIAVAVPCYNEAVTIEKVILNFKKVLPDADVWVFDNNSTDLSGKIAEKAGAIVRKVRKQGKGHVLQSIFNVISADVVVLVDGDDTYYAEDVQHLLTPVLSGEADMVVGNRLANMSEKIMQSHRHLGNRMIVWSINLMFGTNYHDILSGYRVFSKRFIEHVPLLTPGFEIETEMTLQALEEGMIIEEVPISYRSRPADSHSKLNAFRDGYRIMLTAAILLRDHNPLRVFGMVALIFIFAAIGLSAIAVFSLPGGDMVSIAGLSGAVLLGFLGVLSFGLGLILNAINTRFRQLKQILQRNK